MATTSTTSTALSMKLLVDTKAQRVLFTEASKDVVDFLFSLLSLPVGTAVKLLGKDSMVGCVGSLYGSVEKLDSTYVQPGAAKDALLHPAVLSPASSSLLSLPAPASTLQAQPKKFYKCNIECNTSDPFGRQRSCSKCRGYITDTYATTCPSCKNQMTTQLTLVRSTESGGQVAQAAAGVRGWERVRAGHRDVHGDGRPRHDAHVVHLQHHAAQHLRSQRPRRASGEDRADRLQRGFGDPQGVAAVQDRPHRRLPCEEEPLQRLKAWFCL
ncbi:unnamed protein product [Alopecurus aequalis]